VAKQRQYGSAPKPTAFGLLASSTATTALKRFGLPSSSLPVAKRKKTSPSSSAAWPKKETLVQTTLNLGQRPLEEIECRDCKERYYKNRKEDVEKHAKCRERAQTLTLSKLTIAQVASTILLRFLF